ncbi:hypothetical protein RZE82_02865 [Mollicutes bacterium LVI A0039]|nr:hypothetical protein RZE82_02865 [Mollicutes bacterium LVI A0039]
MYDIQQAVDSNGQLLFSHSNCNSECPVGSKIEGTMDTIYHTMQETVELEMKKILISSIMKNFD